MMHSTHPIAHARRAAPMTDTQPIVFVVDDDVSVRESLELLIRFAQWQPRLFESAQAFLSQPPADVPTCLVLDINLPDVSGIDLLTHIKKDKSLDTIPVVILTGSNEDQDIQKSYDLGASSYLVKPISNDALMLVVEKLFDQ